MNKNTDILKKLALIWSMEKFVELSGNLPNFLSLPRGLHSAEPKSLEKAGVQNQKKFRCSLCFPCIGSLDCSQDYHNACEGLK